jgi:hypothetical protein
MHGSVGQTRVWQGQAENASKEKRHGSARKRGSNAADERTCCERPEMQLMRGGAGSIMSNAKAHIFWLGTCATLSCWLRKGRAVCCSSVPDLPPISPRSLSKICRALPACCAPPADLFPISPDLCGCVAKRPPISPRSLPDLSPISPRSPPDLSPISPGSLLTTLNLLQTQRLKAIS